MGFVPVAYRGLETGERNICTHVVRQHNILLAFQSPLTPIPNEHTEAMARHITLHGDGVRDVAFAVDNVEAVFEAAVARGALVIKAPWTETDEHGSVTMATIATVC